MLIKRWLSSLVNRATTLVVIVILVVALTVMLVGGLLSQRELEQQAEAQVRSIAALVSYELDDKLTMRLNIISHVATKLTMTERVFRDRAELLLSRQTELLHLFDGLFILDAEGLLQAAAPGSLWYLCEQRIRYSERRWTDSREREELITAMVT